ncbi:hypothetical protein OESDEN_11383 [Oesophagostomum dentatum]|uniref:Uncharacterized protein n=1 Tax=Oesophagostomum dentatum TaxID=61180 RepID=A0A0B1SZ75_OESDE|nr:hypothetical protein OESDEN_11383 [Oesophagostomum dentatum]
MKKQKLNKEKKNGTLSEDCNMEWIVTADDTRRLKVLEKYATDEGKKVLREVSAKKFLKMDDINAVKVCLFAFLHMSFVSFRDC